METEIWKDVDGYIWRYMVSNLWNIKSSRLWKEVVLKNTVDNYWYHIVTLCLNWIQKTGKIHRIVAKAFIPNADNKPQINHINGIKTDNRVENLEWCTESENVLHAFRTWLKTIWENHNFYTNHPSRWKFWKDNHSAKSVNQYDLLWNLLKEWGSTMDAVRTLWITQEGISKCLTWKQKTAWGFTWKFTT